MFGLFTSLPATAALILSAGAVLSAKCDGYGDVNYCNRHRGGCAGQCGCRGRDDGCGRGRREENDCGCGRR